MKMSEGVEWGLHCVTLLAALPANAVLPGKALAEFHEVSESYLAKHLKRLVTCGIITSLPGPRGGYRLARAAEELTVLDVVLAVEGEIPAFRCTEIRQCGPAAITDPTAYPLPCRIHATMMAAERAWRESLRALRISELAADLGGSLDPRIVERAMVWFNDHVRMEKES